MVVLVVPRLPQLPVAVQIVVCPRRAGGQSQAEAERGQTEIHAGRAAGSGGSGGQADRGAGERPGASRA